MSSARRPVNRGPSAQSSRRNLPPRGSDRVAQRSGRNAPGDDAPEGVSTLKKVMFFGTFALIIVAIVIFVVQGPPGTKVIEKKGEVVRHDKWLDEIDALAKKAAEQFNAAKKVANEAERNRQIQVALKTLDEAQAKLEAMQERKEYQGEEFDQVFGPRMDRMIQERKLYRDSIKVRSGSGR